MQPNAHVQQEIARLHDEWLAGMDEGYHANPNVLPDWYVGTYAYRWTARQRGWWFGRELKQKEIQDAHSTTLPTIC